jgi:hypothetical protein
MHRPAAQQPPAAQGSLPEQQMSPAVPHLAQIPSLVHTAPDGQADVVALAAQQVWPIAPHCVHVPPLHKSAP